MMKTHLGYMNSNSLCSVPRNSAILHLLSSVLQLCHPGKSYLPEQVSGLAFLSHLLQHCKKGIALKDSTVVECTVKCKDAYFHTNLYICSSLRRWLPAIMNFSGALPIEMKTAGISESEKPTIFCSSTLFLIDKFAFNVQAQIL